MRPVNLIPEEQRRLTSGGASRTGPLAFIVVGALFGLLVGVVMLVLASNQISTREGEVAKLEVKKAAATARAERLAPYADFQKVANQRTETVVSLADSRFDWPRVIHQVSLIVPGFVIVTNMTGSAGGQEEGGSSGSGDFSGEIEGPSLSLEGCAKGQNRVAALVAALKQIDGVTRVGLGDSGLAGAGGSSEEGEGSGSECGVRGVEFSVVAAFDAAPPPPEATEATAAEAETASTESGSSSSEGESESSESSSPEATTSTETSGSTKTTISKTTTSSPPE